MAEANSVARERTRQGLFAPFIEARTYVNMLYLLLAFPLGIFYFVFLVTALSVGVSLLIVWVGIPLLVLTIVVWWGLAAFEREMAIRMLGVEIPPMRRETEPVEGLWERLKRLLKNPVTWKGLAFLFIKFPLGIFTFTVVVTMVSVSLGMIAAPFIFPFSTYTLEADTAAWTINTYPEALLVGVLGVGVALLSVYAINWMGYGSAWLARVLLGDPKAVTEEGGLARPEPVPMPDMRMTRQSRTVLGMVLVGFGIWAFVSQVLPALGTLFVPLALIILGVALIVPRAREALAGGEPDTIQDR